jgi:hypothetical protein
VTRCAGFKTLLLSRSDDGRGQRWWGWGKPYMSLARCVVSLHRLCSVSNAVELSHRIMNWEV